MRIGVDSGGTFTDFVVLHDDGQVESFKLRSDRADPASVILAGLDRASSHAAKGRAEVVHGSTVATNAILERKGARTAFVTTAGFEDMLAIARQNRRELYNLTPIPVPPLIPPELCFGVKERAFYDGVIETRPSAAELKRLAARLRRARVESIAVCFLHAYRQPANERAVARALEGLGYLSVSHAVSPEYREYERASTTVVNAYVGPLMERYLSNLAGSSRHRIFVMQSNGGFLTAREAGRQAVRTVLSGPAGGVVGALAMAQASGLSRILGFDMGGTSTDVSLCDGAPRETTEASIDGLPVRVPMIDIHTVGAGGGSIARVDAGGLLRVGPESAGADPGPACYGTGTDATVTGAHVVLGRIHPKQFLGGEMKIDPARSLKAVERIGRKLKLSTHAAAEGILRVANANMERAIRAVSIERGHDPREYALVAFGGGGGLHACQLAEALDIRTVLVPRLAEALSAFGMLAADCVRDYSSGALGKSEHASDFEKLERRALRDLPGAAIERMADIRYAGQSYELTVPWNPRDPVAQFHAEHARVYGYSDPEKATEVVTLRVRARIETDKPALPKIRSRYKTPDLRCVYLDKKWREIAVVRRESMGAKPLSGPALVLDYGTTTLIPRGWTARLDRNANLTVRY